jgi:hypothetical protein
MAIVILISVIFGSFLIVRVGALMLEMTGLDPQQSRFQSLSAFTGTGFTTTEAEMVVRHPTRRRIISALMILGNAGIVTVFASMVRGFTGGSIEGTALNALIVVLAILLLIRLAQSSRLGEALRRRIHARLQKSEAFSTYAFDQILEQVKGYGIMRVAIHPDSRLVGKTLRQLGTTKSAVLVLSIERGEQITAVPRADDRIESGDALLCFGKLDQVRAALGLERPSVEAPA